MDLMNALSFVAVASLLVMSPGPNGMLIAKTVPTAGKIAGFANIAGFIAAFHFHGLLSILGISAILLASSTAFFVVKILGAAYLCWIGIKALLDAFSGNKEAHSAKSTKRGRTNKVHLSPKGEQSLGNQARNIHWPIHMVKEMRVCLKAERHLQQKLDKEPTAEEIAAECAKPVADVTRMLVLRDRALKADASRESDNGRSFHEIISDKNSPRTISKLSAFFEGFLTNALNPKTSMFYLAAFPQFINIGESTAVSAYILVLLHTFINVAWFGAMVILLARLTGFSKSGTFQRWLKGVTGVVFIAFGVKLATYRLQT